MNRVFSSLLVLVWGAWFGSLIGITIAVGCIAMTFPFDDQTNGGINRHFFQITVSAIFGFYERVQLGFAAGAMIFGFAWQLCRGATRVKIALFAIFVLATASSVVETAHVAPKMTQMRTENNTNTPEFQNLHRMSVSLYGANLALMAIAGVLLPIGIVRETRQRAA
jgi:hypothetical protein